MSPKTNSIYLFIYDKKKLITITRVTFDYIIVIQVTIIHKKQTFTYFSFAGAILKICIAYVTATILTNSIIYFMSKTVQRLGL